MAAHSGTIVECDRCGITYDRSDKRTVVGIFHKFLKREGVIFPTEKYRKLYGEIFPTGNCENWEILHFLVDIHITDIINLKKILDFRQEIRDFIDQTNRRYAAIPQRSIPLEIDRKHGIRLLIQIDDRGKRIESVQSFLKESCVRCGAPGDQGTIVNLFHASLREGFPQRYTRSLFGPEWGYHDSEKLMECYKNHYHRLKQMNLLKVFDDEMNRSIQEYTRRLQGMKAGTVLYSVYVNYTRNLHTLQVCMNRTREKKENI